MIYIPYLASSAASEADKPISLNTPKPPYGREHLRHVLLGSRKGIEEAVQRMQVMKYAEQFLWSREIRAPDSSILLTPNRGEVLRYLMGWRRLT